MTWVQFLVKSLNLLIFFSYPIRLIRQELWKNSIVRETICARLSLFINFSYPRGFLSVADLRVALPTTVENFLNFTQFFGKFVKIIGLCPLPWGLAPILRGVLESIRNSYYSFWPNTSEKVAGWLGRKRWHIILAQSVSEKVAGWLGV